MNQFKQIEQPLKKVVQKVNEHQKQMLRTVMTHEEVEEDYKKLADIKHYDRLQRRQLMEQKNCQTDYEQSESDSEEEETYKKLDVNQLKYLIREKLIKQKMCPTLLEKIVLYDPQLEKGVLEEMQLDSADDINDTLMSSGKDAERILSQVNEVYASDERNHKNLKALKFIIEELEAIQNQK